MENKLLGTIVEWDGERWYVDNTDDNFKDESEETSLFLLPEKYADTGDYDEIMRLVDSYDDVGFWVYESEVEPAEEEASTLYYDVVCSIYDSEECNQRRDSHLICGGFETVDEATDYIRNNDCSQFNYCCLDGEYPCVEIEVRNEDGCFMEEIIPVD